MRPIYSDDQYTNTTIETLIRMGYTLEEAKSIVEAAPSVSSHKKLLSSAGLTLRHIRSGIEEELLGLSVTDDTTDSGDEELVVEEVVEGEPGSDFPDVEDLEIDPTFEGTESLDVSTTELLDTLKTVSAMVEAIITVAGEEPEPMTYNEALEVVESMTSEAASEVELEDSTVEEETSTTETTDSVSDDFGLGTTEDVNITDESVDNLEETVTAGVVRVSYSAGNPDVVTPIVQTNDSAIELISGIDGSVFSSDAFEPVSEEEEVEEEVVVTNSSRPSGVWSTYKVRPTLFWNSRSEAHKKAWSRAYKTVSSQTTVRSPSFLVAVQALAQTFLKTSRELDSVSRNVSKRHEVWSEAVHEFKSITGKEPTILDYPVVNHLYRKLIPNNKTRLVKRKLQLMNCLCRVLLGSLS